MKLACNVSFALQSLTKSDFPDVAAFLHSWYKTNGASSKLVSEPVSSIERRLKWLLIDNPAAAPRDPLGYCVRNDDGHIKGLDLCFPAAFVSGDKRLLGLGSGTFLVDPSVRSLGFYLFKKCVDVRGYDFYFASTCNPYSSQLWRALGARPLPKSDIEYIVPIQLDAVLSAYVSHRLASPSAVHLARICGRSVNPLLRLLTRPSTPKLTVEPCHDWDKLAALFQRHRSSDDITDDRTPELLEWRYGPDAPSHPCEVYLFRDSVGNEGWFALADIVRGKGGQFRAAVLLDLVWPRTLVSSREIFHTIFRVAAGRSDAICFRWQPGLNSNELKHFVIPRKLEAPRALVRTAKGVPQLKLESLNYDDSESLAWIFQWRQP